MPNPLTLGIATIGDLLLHNRITQVEGDREITDLVLTIPAYQRPYKWTGKNVNQLFDDILFAKKENKEVYRVGTLILHEDHENKCHNIVDGLQRTISFALLLHALEIEIKKIKFLQQKLSFNPFNAHNIPSNYRAFKRRVKNLSETERNDLREYIETRCELIVVITDDQSEAFQFFDSQNARGKKLYPHDLLKAYHLREMNHLSAEQTEKVVKTWEDLDQKRLSALFTDYLYRLKEWLKGNKAFELNEHNIDIFKGVAASDTYPYAQYYKGAFAYADDFNRSSVPSVTGAHPLRPFQLDAPIIAGKPFFDYAKHYFDILADIRNNDKYEGYLLNDNEIVKTLNLRENCRRTGDRITRLLFDTAILLYADRFCPEEPSQKDSELLDQFVLFAFVWAYSLRAQYYSVRWSTAQNYILGKEGKINSFNLYKTISEADSPMALLSVLSDLVVPLPEKSIKDSNVPKTDIEEKVTETGIYRNYLHFFAENNFMEGKE